MLGLYMPPEVPTTWSVMYEQSSHVSMYNRHRCPSSAMVPFGFVEGQSELAGSFVESLVVAL